MDTRSRSVRNKEKNEFLSNKFCLDFEPVADDNDPVLCYFIDSIHLPFRSYIVPKVKA